MKEGSPKAGALFDIHTLKSIADIDPVDRPAEMNRLAKLIEEELEKDPSIPRALGEVASREGVDRETILLGYRYLTQKSE